MIELLNEREKYEDIIALCEQALIIEPYEEAIHIYLMESMLKLGQVKSALSHYYFITSSQSDDVGYIPSIAMKNIYNKIHNHYNIKSNIDIKNIRNKLEDEEHEGSIFCDSEYFKFVYNIERKKRKSITSDEDDYICLIDLYQDYNKEELKNWARIMTFTLKNSLRKGDLFTFWNDTQILVLLLNSNEKGPNKIKERIMNNLPNNIRKDIQISFTKLICEDNFFQESLV